MEAVINRVRAFLDANQIPYEALRHEPDFSAQETAAHTHTPGKEFAKTVLLRKDGQFVLAVLPAHHRIDFEKLVVLLDAKSIMTASETDLRTCFPDCEVGAEPPMGHLYDLPVYLSWSMAVDRRITFNAGTHEEAIRMSADDFIRWVKPLLGDFSYPA